MTRQDEWIEEAQRNGYKYIVGCGDTYDYSYYPCYCKTKEEADEKARSIRSSPMQKVFEIIEVKPAKRKRKSKSRK